MHMEIRPITFRTASDYVNQYHRHHRAMVGGVEHGLAQGVSRRRLVAVVRRHLEIDPVPARRELERLVHVRSRSRHGREPNRHGYPR